MPAETWRLSSGPINVQNQSVFLGGGWEESNQISYSPFDRKFDERVQIPYLYPSQEDPASLSVLPQPEPRNEALQTDLQEGFHEASFPEEDIEEDMVMNLVPVRSYRVNLRVRKARKGKLELIYEEELEKEEL